MVVTVMVVMEEVVGDWRHRGGFNGRVGNGGSGC